VGISFLGLAYLGFVLFGARKTSEVSMNIEDEDLPLSEPIRKQRRGFALMNPDRLKEISAKGGKRCPDAARGFSNPEVARLAARLGGRRKR
jgi:hypothetical protein